MQDYLEKLGSNFLAAAMIPSLACVITEMVLFASGRGEVLRRCLVEEGVVQQARFWRLAQALGPLGLVFL